MTTLGIIQGKVLRGKISNKAMRRKWQINCSNKFIKLNKNNGTNRFNGYILQDLYENQEKIG